MGSGKSQATAEVTAEMLAAGKAEATGAWNDFLCSEAINEILTDVFTAMQERATMSGEPYEPVLQWFEYRHLREDLQPTSKYFHDLAHQMVQDLPQSPERTVALRKLLESKDAAVRAKLWKPAS